MNKTCSTSAVDNYRAVEVNVHKVSSIAASILFKKNFYSQSSIVS